MKKLGIIGGTSWASTALYYEQINRGVAQRLGGLHSALLAFKSLDLTPIAAMQQSGGLGGGRTDCGRGGQAACRVGGRGADPRLEHAAQGRG